VEHLSPHADAAAGPVLPVELPTFAGPLDLLLHLIRKNRVSIYDIPIASICDQYQESLRRMQDLDLEVAGEFVWMASWLLALKSRMLLPRPPGDDEADPRGELVERLLEYRRVKELAALLYDTDVVRRCLWPVRLPLRSAPEELELDWEDVDLRLLARTYLEVMQRHEAMHPPPLEVPPLRYTVRETMSRLYRRVVEDEVGPLLRLMHSRADDEEVVVLFVAVLELVRLGGVLAEQRRPFSEIWLRRGRVTLGDGQLAPAGGDGRGP